MRFKKEKFNSGTTTNIIITNECDICFLGIEVVKSTAEEKVSFSGKLSSGTSTLELKGLSEIQYEFSGDSNYLILNCYSGTGIMSPKEKILRITLTATGVIGKPTRLNGSNKISTWIRPFFKP